MSDLEENFRILRVTLEGRFSEPAVFTITSAQSTDGSTYVASGVARAFAEQGQPTLLIGASSTNVASEFGLDRAARSEVTTLGTLWRVSESPNLRVLPIAEGIRNGAVACDVESALAALRQSFRAIIVDTSPLQESSNSYRFARGSDGILIAIRFGRKPLAADRELLALLGESAVETIGVVPTRNRRTNGQPKKALPDVKPMAEFEPASRLGSTRKTEVAS